MAGKASLFAFILRSASQDCFQCEMSNFHYCVYLTWFIWWLRSGMKVLPNHQEKKKWPFSGYPPTYSTVWREGNAQPHFLFFFLNKDPQCDCDPVRMLCGPVPCWDDWVRLSLTHCETVPVRLAEDSFHSPAHPKYQTMCPNGKCRQHIKKTPCSDAFPMHHYLFITQTWPPNNTWKASNRSQLQICSF